MATPTPDPLAAIRQRLAEQIEQAAQELEQQLSRDTITRAAYDQGRHDERNGIATSLQAWLDQIPPGKRFDQLRTALEAILTTLRPA